MKRFIGGSSEYPDYMTIQHGRQRFSVHIDQEGPYRGSFAAQITEIHPYDDADYAWAKIQFNGQVVFIKNGQIVDKMQLPTYEEDDYEEVASVDAYISDMLDTVAVELMYINKDVKPNMIHN